MLDRRQRRLSGEDLRRADRQGQDRQAELRLRRSRDRRCTSSARLINAEAGIKTTHVPYKGVAPALNDLLGGHIQLLSADLPVLEPLVKSGKVRALALFATERSPLLPDLPTSAELGYPAHADGQLVRHAGARRHTRQRAGDAGEGDARSHEEPAGVAASRGGRAWSAGPTARDSPTGLRSDAAYWGRSSRSSASKANEPGETSMKWLRCLCLVSAAAAALKRRRRGPRTIRPSRSA